jgi:hypothetical protein
MDEAAEQPSHARVGERREPLPLKQDHATVVGLKHPSKLGHERRIDSLPKKVGRGSGLRDARWDAPRPTEVASLDAGVVKVTVWSDSSRISLHSVS